jgi:ABC-type maltose transport system permease subunit
MLDTFANIFLPISAPAFVVVLIWQFTSMERFPLCRI